MDLGWTKSWRKRWDSDLATYPNANHLFQYLIDSASYKERDTSFRYQCVHLMPGDVLIGAESVAKKTGLTRRSVRTCLEYLKTTNRVTIRSTKRFSVVSIIKWDTYQGDDSSCDHQNDHQNDHQPTIKRPSTDHIQEVKKLKKDQNPVAVRLYGWYADNISNIPAKRSDAIRNITKLLNAGHTEEDLGEAMEEYNDRGPHEKPYHANNFFGQKEYYRGFGKYAKEGQCSIPLTK